MCSLEERRRAAQQAEYDALVEDVTQNERTAAEASSRGFLPSARLQMSQGIHVCVTMGVGYALGVAAGRSFDMFGEVTVRFLEMYGSLLHERAMIVSTAL